MINSEGSLNILNTTKPIDSPESFNLEIQSFSQPLNFTYQFEALPLDYLTFNNMTLESELCESSKPWLKCLVAKSNDLFTLESCIDNFEVLFSYGFNNLEEYSNNVSIQVKNFTQKFNLFCKRF